MHILIAPNAFKNSIDAHGAALAIQEGLHQSKLKCTTECFAIADGGDGTGALIIEKLGGTRVEAEVEDPFGRKIRAAFGLIENGRTAIIEMADASGLRLLNLNELNPLKASSYGTGELIKHALDKGANKIILAMGGSATVDGGAGILSALGIRFLNNGGKNIRAIPEILQELSSLDTSTFDARILKTEVIVLCDVGNELLGAMGSATVFGPQKGASKEDVKRLEEVLKKLSEAVMNQCGKNMATIKYGGTAGGAAAGLFAGINATLVNGIEYFLELTNFDEALNMADVVITGEGSIDIQTIQGKGPFGVALKAKKKGIPVIGIAGKVPLVRDSVLHQYFDVLLPIGHKPASLPDAFHYSKENLTRTSIEIGNLLSLCHK